jgi:hypothetical protein
MESNMLRIRRIIDGKAYDTTTAKFSCAVIKKGGAPSCDPYAETTRIYKTHEGQWFLAGVGGALSRWGNNISAGKGLTLITPDEAIEALGPNLLVEYFSIRETE